MKWHKGRSEPTLLSLLSALTNFLFVASQNMGLGWGPRILVVVVLGVGGLEGGLVVTRIPKVAQTPVFGDFSFFAVPASIF